MSIYCKRHYLKDPQRRRRENNRHGKNHRDRDPSRYIAMQRRAHQIYNSGWEEATMRHMKWDIIDESRVLQDIPIKQLSRELGRSMAAIQNKRDTLRKN